MQIVDKLQWYIQSGDMVKHLFSFYYINLGGPCLVMNLWYNIVLWWKCISYVLHSEYMVFFHIFYSHEFVQYILLSSLIKEDLRRKGCCTMYMIYSIHNKLKHLVDVSGNLVKSSIYLKIGWTIAVFIRNKYYKRWQFFVLPEIVKFCILVQFIADNI